MFIIPFFCLMGMVIFMQWLQMNAFVLSLQG